MRHPCERWGSNYTLKRLVFLAVRDALQQPAHPDSKRQARRRARDLERHGARVLKESCVTSCPVTRNSKKREVREMRHRLQAEQEKTASTVADRLLGKTPNRELDTLLGCRESYRIAEGLLQKGWTYRRGEK